MKTRLNRMLAMLLSVIMVVGTIGTDYVKAYADDTVQVETEAVADATDDAEVSDQAAGADEEAIVAEAPKTDEDDQSQTDVITEDAGANVDDDAQVTEEVNTEDSDADVSGDDAEIEEEPEEILPELEFNQSVTVNGIDITLWALPGVLPADAELRVAPLSTYYEEKVAEYIEENTGNAIEATYSFDINIYSEEAKGYVQPEDGTVSVTFEAVPDAASADTTLSVYHVEQKDAEIAYATPVADGATGDAISFDAEHFSVYTVVVRNTAQNASASYSFSVKVMSYDDGKELSENVTEKSVEVTGYDKNIPPATFADEISGYKFVKATKDKKKDAKEIKNIQLHDGRSGTRLRYTTDDKNWKDIGNSTLYFWYEKDNTVAQKNVEWYVDGQKVKTTQAAVGTRPSYGSTPSRSYNNLTYSFLGWTTEKDYGKDSQYYSEADLPVVSENDTTIKYYAMFTVEAYCYFLLPDKKFTSTSSGDYMYAGTATVIVPDGIGGSRWYASDHNLGKYIVSEPSDEAIRQGIRTYYKDYVSTWGYTLTINTLSHNSTASGYDYSLLNKGMTLHLDYGLSLDKTREATISYVVNGYDLMYKDQPARFMESKTHTKGQEVSINSSVKENQNFTTDGINYRNNSKRVRFDGWYTDESYSTKAPDKITVTTNVTYYGRYVANTLYDVEYQYNNEGNTQDTTIKYAEGELVNIVSDPTWDGHTFTGWKVVSGIVTDKTYKSGDSFYMPANKAVLQAQWEVSTFDVTVTDKFIDNDGTSYEVTRQLDKNKYNLNEGYSFSALTKEEQSTIGHPGYAVEGQTTYSGNVTGNLNITFIYRQETYKVTFVTNKANVTVPEQTGLVYWAQPTRPADPIANGSRFLGWYTDNGTFNNEYDFANEHITEDVILYGKWIEVFTVKYLPGEFGTFETQEYTVDKGDNTPAFVGDKTGKDGFVFVEWTPEVSASVTANAEYTATWKYGTTINVTAKTYSKEYDGTPLEGGYEVSPALPAGYTIAADDVTYDKDPSIAEVGTLNYAVTAVKIIKGTKDVTSLFDINYGNGTLTVNKANLTITADSNSKEYDGTALTDNGWQDTAPIGLKGFDVVESVTVTGSQTEVDSSANVASNAVVKNNETDVTANYNIKYVDGTLKVTQSTKAIVITSSTNSWTYDGNNHKDEVYTLTFDGVAVTADSTGKVFTLPTGDTITITPTSAGVKNVADNASNNNTYTYVLENANYYSNVTANYGTLTIGQKAVTVTANNASKKYGDADPATFTATVAGTFGNDSVQYSVSRAAGENAGTYAITPSGEAIQGNYAVTYVPGTFTINKRNVTITSEGGSKTYDGTALTKPVVVVSGDGFVEGEVSIINATGSVTNVSEGKVTNSIEIVPNDSFKADNYNINLVEGELYITPVTDEVVVTIVGKNLTTDYANFDYEVSGYSVEFSNELYTESDYHFDGNAKAHRRNMGTTFMNLVEAQFSNISDNFTNVRFDITDGYVTINPRKVTVTITGNKASYMYNRETFGVEGFTIEISDDLYRRLERVIFSGNATVTGYNAGKYPMGLDAEQFINPNGNFDVTFEVTDGELEITQRPATISIGDYSKARSTEDPTFTGTISGVLPGDSLGVSYTRAAGEENGYYAITASYSNKNYIVTLNPGTLTIYEAGPIEENPEENPPVENPPVENPPTENPPAENPPVVNPPAEEPEEPEVVIEPEPAPLAPTVEIEPETVPLAPAVEIEEEPTPLAAADHCLIHWIVLLTALIYGAYATVRGISLKKENEEQAEQAQN